MSARREAIAELFETLSLRAPENAVGFVLWRVFHRWQREADLALSDLGLTHLQFTTLTLVAWMVRSDALASQSDLARFGDISPMQVSLMLKALEAKGLVARKPSETNRSGKQVAITAKGLDVLRQALPVIVDLQAKLFGREGRPGGSLLTALRRIADAE
jgi:DNA-binding MarR family transcriptional regulator